MRSPSSSMAPIIPDRGVVRYPARPRGPVHGGDSSIESGGENADEGFEDGRDDHVGWDEAPGIHAIEPDQERQDRSAGRLAENAVEADEQREGRDGQEHPREVEVEHEDVEGEEGRRAEKRQPMPIE